MQVAQLKVSHEIAGDADMILLKDRLRFSSDQQRALPAGRLQSAKYNFLSDAHNRLDFAPEQSIACLRVAASSTSTSPNPAGQAADAGLFW